jgi:hypothetical protein
MSLSPTHFKTTLPIRLSFTPPNTHPKSHQFYSRDETTTSTLALSKATCFLSKSHKKNPRYLRIPIGPYLFSATRLRSSMEIGCKIPRRITKKYPGKNDLEISDPIFIYLRTNEILSQLRQNSTLSRNSSFHIKFFITTHQYATDQDSSFRLNYRIFRDEELDFESKPALYSKHPSCFLAKGSNAPLVASSSYSRATPLFSSTLETIFEELRR